jgi:hypothetical protein
MTNLSVDPVVWEGAMICGFAVIVWGCLVYQSRRYDRLLREKMRLAARRYEAAEDTKSPN